MDIICRWRDAISDPPPDGKAILLHGANADELLVAYRRGTGWHEWEGHDIRIDPGDQWLDVTDVPAVAVPKVQAAVDEIEKWDSVEGILCDIEKYTGVVPSVVKDSLTTETDMSDVQCPVCGYYCLGKGGVECIDKPSMVSHDR